MPGVDEKGFTKSYVEMFCGIVWYFVVVDVAGCIIVFAKSKMDATWGRGAFLWQLPVLVAVRYDSGFDLRSHLWSPDY